MEPAATVVRIQGQEYTIRSEADPEYVRRIASYVDDRMQEVARSSQQVSSLRVAILAALNIADELFRVRDGGGPEAQALEDRALELAATLEDLILGDAPADFSGGDDSPEVP